MNCLTEEFFAFMEENKELGFVKGVVDYDAFSTDCGNFSESSGKTGGKL
jgi:hypothetical protein